MNTQNKRKKGFTLIELLVVITIIGILAGIVIANLSGVTDQAEIEAVKGNLKTLHNTMLGAKPPIKTLPTSAELIENSPAGFAAWFRKRTGFTNNDVWYVKNAEDVIELSANDNEKGGVPNQIAKSTGDFHPDFNADQKKAISWEMCIPTDAAKQKTLRDLKRTGKFPVIWTKGLQSDGTWEGDSPWGGAGGHVLFSDGTIKWYETAEDQFVNAQSEEMTSDVEQAIPEGWQVIKSN